MRNNYFYLSTFSHGGFCIISYTYSEYWNRIDKSEIITNYNWTLDFIKEFKSWAKSNERDLLIDTILN